MVMIILPFFNKSLRVQRRKMEKENRGPNPSIITKYQLIAKAAGRCQYCNKDLFTEKISLEDNNDSNLAHIVASSPNGPRGSEELSHKLSDKIENLMLMCTEHHHLIDQHPEIYTVDVLTNMKKDRERRVYELVDTCTFKETEVVMLLDPIKGRTPVSISMKDAVQAFLLKYVPANTHGIFISFNSNLQYRSSEYWKQAVQFLEYKFNQMIVTALQYNPQMHFSVFALAPIPFIIKLGDLFQDKIGADVYQKTRNPDTWKWLSYKQTNKFTLEKHGDSVANPKIAVILGLTAEIADERVREVMDADIIYRMRPERCGVDCISSKKDLKAFWHIYQKILDEICNDYPNVNEISLFPAIPVSAAFEVGRRNMPGVYPKIKIYDEDNGFFETITIGGCNNE